MWLAVVFTFTITLQTALLTRDSTFCMVPNEHPNYIHIDNRICGQLDDNRSRQLVEQPGGAHARMIGGEPVQLGAMPWVVSLKMFLPGNEYGRECMGTIIGKNHILTSGSCTYFDGQKAESTVVYAGDSILRKNDCVFLNNRQMCAPLEKQLSVNDTHVHRLLWRSLKYDYDLAVLQLQENLTWSGFLRPICLSEKCSDPDEYAEEEFTMVGYGYDEANDQSDGHKLNLDYRIHKAIGIGVRRADCQRRWQQFNRSVIISSRVICVDPEDQTKKPCGENLGAPLTQETEETVAGEKRKAHRLIGVLAFGLNCREENPVVNPPPLVYMNVGLFSQWIMNNLGWRHWVSYEYIP